MNCMGAIVRFAQGDLVPNIMIIGECSVFYAELFTPDAGRTYA
jgi:hypothetical protein